jgi:Putative amidoligase enzyme
LQAAWPTRPEVSYTNDIEAFQHDYEQARDRHTRGEPAVPYLTDNATGGLGARDGGRGFGVEIEFDFPSTVNRGEAINGIARDLHAAGLSRHTVQAGYHAAHREGYTDAPNGWRLESDCTVAGEIVSPIMYDEPATWHNLDQVCEIVRRHGGRASYNTGGHIHVSTHDYDHTVENHNRLLQLATGYQDTLYRLAQNPEAPRHRGRSYCYPNRDPGNGYTSVGSVRTNNAGHGPAVNFGSVRGASNDHVEMRLWDGSLSPAVIQTQIKLSLGMTAAASRGGFTPPAREPVGSHREINRGQHTDGRLHDQTWTDNTASFRTLIDTIYTRAADKAQATALFALTRWQQR